MSSQYDWDFFAGYDDETLIPINLTAQELALLRSAFSSMQEVSAWSDEVLYYQEIQYVLETIEYLIREGEA